MQGQGGCIVPDKGLFQIGLQLRLLADGPNVAVSTRGNQVFDARSDFVKGACHC